MGGGRKPYYGVANGRVVGVFTSWEECERAVTGFSNAVFKGFNSQAEAVSFVSGYARMMQHRKDSQDTPPKTPIAPDPPHQSNSLEARKVLPSWRSSGALSSSPASTVRVESQRSFFDDIEIIDITTSPQTKPFNPVPLSPILSSYNSSAPKRTYPGDDKPTKKSKFADIEIIDLTDSPPKQRLIYSTQSSSSVNSLTSLFSASSTSSASSVNSSCSPLTKPSRKQHNPAYPTSTSTTTTSSYSNSKSTQSTYIRPVISSVVDLFSSTQPLPSIFSSISKPTPNSVKTAHCSPEQRRILDLVSQGKNVFFTGSAGVGKSFVLNKITEVFKAQGLKEFSDFFVTASTGIAAVHIGGMTVHSFSGIGQGEDGVEGLKKKIARTERVRTHWENCRTLIIDEISMLSDDLFDKLDEIARHIRKSERPFGGIQLVLCGDFYQLPPVPCKKRRCPRCGGFNAQPKDGYKLQCQRKSDPPCNAIFPKNIGYVFQSEAWKRASFNIIELTKVFRQSDNVFVTALNKTRLGKPDPATLKLFEQCRRPLGHDANIKPTKMYPIRALVQEENIREFEALKTPIHTYKAVDNQICPDNFSKDMLHVLKDLQAANEIKLRAGTQVMLLANLDVKDGLVNGSRGVIVDFVSYREALDYLVNQAKTRGASSKEESKGVAELNAFVGANTKINLPKVLFETKNTTKEIVVTPYTWSMKLGWNLEVSRIQIPLMSAWALTIHKCQGMTLEKCVLDLGRCFGYGMAYVALSRCKSLEGLEISGWKGGKEIQADPVVAEFYGTISRI